MNDLLVQEGVLALDDAWVTVKTQFLPANMHVTIIGLLKYIKEHHLPSLEVDDEGEYWETGDYRVLEDKMGVNQKRSITHRANCLPNTLATRQAYLRMKSRHELSGCSML